MAKKPKTPKFEFPKVPKHKRPGVAEPSAKHAFMGDLGKKGTPKAKADMGHSRKKGKK